MSHKQYPQFNAKPVNQAIDEIVPKLDRMLNNKVAEDDHAQLFQVGPMEGRDKLAQKLKEIVNPDVCLTSSQCDRLIFNMMDYLNNPNEAKLLAIATFINSCRTECSRCLAQNCKQRDIHDVE